MANWNDVESFSFRNIRLFRERVAVDDTWRKLRQCIVPPKAQLFNPLAHPGNMPTESGIVQIEFAAEEVVAGM